MALDHVAVKQVQRKMWSVGDFPDIAQTIQEAADAIVEVAAPQQDDLLLDVATGSGNVAIPAAQRGATVTGLDLTPELFAAARARAADAGVGVEWIEGDAEALPFEDDYFDCVTSSFGVMFAPRQQIAADELLRVAKPGAAIVVTAWTPEGLNGRMFTTIGSHMPPPDPEFQAPILWGTEDRVRELLAAASEVRFERRTVTFGRASLDEWVDYAEATLGPVILAKAALEPQGKWDTARDQLIDLYGSHNEADDGSFRVQAEYLLTVARA